MDRCLYGNGLRHERVKLSHRVVIKVILVLSMAMAIYDVRSVNAMLTHKSVIQKPEIVSVVNIILKEVDVNTVNTDTSEIR